ncbi:bile acid:sodium symporter family protein [Membranihabitans maritimus]|uniref:bile acid:sodium symporter family protein n=1 Tax=Membranihabitans maritimus TaxID=2904244 RepID=UPI001F30E5A6|nr:bile acid:sodium symporter family protein [Membranihabitans maritimus]
MDSVSNIILTVALVIIMWGMGLSLVIEDFKRVVKYPRAVVIGLCNQLILLPIIGYLLVSIMNVPPDIAIGVMILAACPGGATSNLIAHLAKGDTALSVSLTAISSIVTVFTIPLIVNFAMVSFLDQAEMIQLSVLDTILKMCIVVVIPVAVGMIIRKYRSGFADRMGKPVRIASAILLMLIIVGIIIREKDQMPGYFAQAGIVTFLLNLITMVIGYFGAKLLMLQTPQAISISVESGIQNGTLALAVAGGLLGNSAFAIAPAVYSIIMFLTGGAIIYLGLRMSSGRVDTA